MWNQLFSTSLPQFSLLFFLFVANKFSLLTNELLLEHQTSHKSSSLRPNRRVVFFSVFCMCITRRRRRVRDCWYNESNDDDLTRRIQLSIIFVSELNNSAAAAKKWLNEREFSEFNIFLKNSLLSKRTNFAMLVCSASVRWHENAETKL